VKQQDLLELDVDIQTALDTASAQRVEEIVRMVCADIACREDLASAYLSVTIVGDAHIQGLNRDYRGRDLITDVLSFALLEGDEEPEISDGQEEPQCLGDVVICWPQLVRQAQEFGHSWERELAFLAAHGMLHVLGYDHEGEEQERAMFALQEDVLTGLAFTR